MEILNVNFGVSCVRKLLPGQTTCGVSPRQGKDFFDEDSVDYHLKKLTGNVEILLGFDVVSSTQVVLFVPIAEDSLQQLDLLKVHVFPDLIQCLIH